MEESDETVGETDGEDEDDGDDGDADDDDDAADEGVEGDDWFAIVSVCCVCAECESEFVKIRSISDSIDEQLEEVFEGKIWCNCQSIVGQITCGLFISIER